MSTYKYLDDNGLIYYHSKVKALLNNKVDKVSGKGLSTNDYTTAEKNKLSGIAAGAEVNQYAYGKVTVGSTTSNALAKQDTLEFVGGTGINISSDTSSSHIKINFDCDTEIPTKTSDLTNDSGFITNTDYASSNTGGTIKATNTYGLLINGNGELYCGSYDGTSYSNLSGYAFISKQTLTNRRYEESSNKVTSMSSSSTDTQYPSAKCVYDAIQDAIGSVTGLNFEVVQTLPASGTAGTIYLVPNGGTTPNIYDEYVWITNAFEKIGTTAVDLSGYVQKTEMVAITNAEIDTIVA